MKKLFFSRFLSLLMVSGLLLSHIPLAAIAYSSKDVSAQEDALRYIYLGTELSNLAQIVEQASMLDEDQGSLLHAMKKYMNDGFFVAGYEEVMEALEYAQSVVERNISKGSRDTTKNKLRLEISGLIEQIMDGALCFDQTSLERGCKPKSSCPVECNDEDCNNILNCCRFLLINKELQVCGNALFKGKVKIKDDLNVGGDLRVRENAVFKEDVKIKGSLTAADAFISILDTTTLSVTNGFIDNLSVTDLVVSGCVGNLCVDSLSVTDLVVTSCMDSLCVESFSAVDAVIDNLVITSSILDALIVDLTVTGSATITDLVVLSCMDTLCVNALSVTDISISGTLSVNDIIIDDATVTSFSATDVVINNSLTVASLTSAGVVHNNAAGLLSSSLIVNADVAAGAGIVDTKLATISTAGKVSNSATTATSANTPNTIVLRDGAGNFSAGTITAALNGNATTATTATNFSGALAGEVTGTQGATVVTNAVSANTANAIVRRNGTGGFSASVISVTDDVVSGNLILTTNPSTSTAGNILKGANRFIHNFGTQNTFVGQNAGNFTLSGVGNVGVGDTALTALTTGNQNTAVGLTALASNTTGASNTAIGFRAMGFNTIGLANTAVGQNALLNNIDGIDNTSIGAHSLEANTSGNINVAVGFNALTANTTGVQNTACGCNTLEQLTTGINNTAIGKFAGQNASGASSNNIYINNLGTVENNTIRIGNSIDQASCFIAGIRGATTGVADAIAVLIDSTGQLGTISSSEKVKHDIEDMGIASNDVLNLRPVTFVYNGDESNTTQFGLIAEEVDQIFPAIVVHDKAGQPETVQYHVLPILLLNEMKKQQLTINDLQSLVKNCLDRVSALEIQA